LTTSRALLSRTGVVLPLVVLLTGGILTADASSGEATGQQATAAACTLNVPSKIAIAAPHQAPTFTIGADCTAAGVIDARWEAKRSDGLVVKKAFFNFSYPSSWSVFDTTGLTKWTWQPAGARTPGDITLADNGQATPSDTNTTEQAEATVPQNTPTTDIRMMSKVDGVETDIPYHVAVWAQRYAITPHGLINYGGISGSIQQLNAGTGGWYVIASFTTASNGRWDGTLPCTWEGTTQSRRAVIYDGQYIFGSISPTYTGTVDTCADVAAPSTTSAPNALGVLNPQIVVSKDDPGPLEPPTDR
jgi:hypothetical protein